MVALATPRLRGRLPAPRRRPRREPSALPGFAGAFGFTLLYASLIILLPLAALAARPWEHGLSGFVDAILKPRTLAALRLSFTAALLAAAANVATGLLIAWVLGRYRFPGRRVVDALVDLPLCPPHRRGRHRPGHALRNLPAGSGLSSLAWVRRWPTRRSVFSSPCWPSACRSWFAPCSRCSRISTAAWRRRPRTLGAGPLETFARVILPTLTPALITGFALAFARGAGEYGSVIFIAGNMPGVSEIAPLVIVTRLEQYDYAGAASVGLAMLALSLLALVAVNAVQVALLRRGKR